MRVIMVGSNGGYNNYTPLDMAYVKAYCKDLPHKFDIYTIHPSATVKSVSESIFNKEPDIVIFFLDNLKNTQVFALPFALSLFSKLRNKLPKCSFWAQTYKLNYPLAKKALAHSDMNLLILNEPEHTVYELITGHDNIGGIIYKEKDGTIKNTKDKPLAQNLDNLPSPYLTGTIVPKRHRAMISTSRGCIFNCFYCFRSSKFEEIRYFSVKRVLEEINMLRDAGCYLIDIIDDCYITDINRFTELTGKIAFCTKGKAKFRVMVRPEFLTYRNIELLKQMNTKYIQIGAQTLNPQLLCKMQRKLDIEALRKGVKQLKNFGAHVELDIILGLPGDNLEEFKNTVRELTSLPIDTLWVNQLFVTPGSYISTNLGKFNIELSNDSPVYLPRVLGNDTFPKNDIIKALNFLEDMKSISQKIKITNNPMLSENC